MTVAYVVIAGVDAEGVGICAAFVVASLRELTATLVCAMKSHKVSVVVSKVLAKLSTFWANGLESRLITTLALTSSMALLIIC